MAGRHEEYTQNLQLSHRSPVLFGWVGEHYMQARRRKSNRGILRSTLTHVDKDADRFMVALPAGAYVVTLGVGDPEFGGPLRFAVQGVQVWDGEPAAAGDFLTKKVRVRVGQPTPKSERRRLLCGLDDSLFLRLEGKAKPLGRPHRCAGLSTPGPDASRIAFLKIRPVAGMTDAFRQKLRALAMRATAARHANIELAPMQLSSHAGPRLRARAPLASDYLVFTSPKPIGRLSSSTVSTRDDAIKNAQQSVQRVFASWALMAPIVDTLVFSFEDQLMRNLAELLD